MDNIVSAKQPIKPSHFEEGALILVDKPISWTSFDVVNKLRYAISAHLRVKKFKVGHAGTLDPQASGLLTICIGKYTKKIDRIVAFEKEYTGEITLGYETPSLDSETLPRVYYPFRNINDTDIRNAENHFIGESEQIPPMYSAVKIKGTALYHLARKGEEVVRKPRKISISSLELTKDTDTTLLARVVCSKGTYIRTLAYDIGRFLETGAYLSALRRTRIGHYSVEDAVSIEAFIAQIKELELSQA